jgi:DHA2 family multidrug resistance protein-like MFS transporter
MNKGLLRIRPRVWDNGSGDAPPALLRTKSQTHPSLPDPTDVYDATAGVPMPQRITAIAAVSFGSALVVIDGAIPTVALPRIATDLNVGSSAVVSIITIYQLVLVMTLLPFSGLGDRIGLKRLYQIGQIIFTVATILCFFAKSLPFLLIVRVAQGIGAGATLSVSSALVRATYPSNQLGRGLALNTLVVSSGAAIAPSLGGLVLAIAPWPWVFASAVPFALLSLLFGRWLPDPRTRPEPFDLLGAVMCAAMFGLIIGGLESGVDGDSPVVSGAIVAVGIFIAFLIVRMQRHQPAPILPIDLLRSPVIALSVFGGFCAFIGSMTLILSMSFRLQHGFGFSPSEAGTIIGIWPLTMMVVAPAAGYLSDRYPAGLLGGIGMVIGVTALLLIAFLPVHPDYWTVAWRMSLAGLGFGMYLSPNARLIIGSAPHDRVAPAGGLVSTTRLVGQTMGATLVAALLAFGIGGGSAPALVAAALATIAGITSITRLRPTFRNAGTADAAH